MSSLRQKSAPRFQPSSRLLDKRWKEHDYLVHKYRLNTIQGKLVHYPEYAPISPRAASAKPEPVSKSTVTFQRNVKSAKTERTRIDVYVRPTASARPATVTSRPPTKNTIRPVPPFLPQRNRWVKSANSRKRSEYSLDAQNEHWKRHLYYRNVILGRRGKKSPRRIKDKQEEEKVQVTSSSSSGDEADIEDEEPDAVNKPSSPSVSEKEIPKTPTPEPKQPTPEPDPEQRMDLGESESDVPVEMKPKPPAVVRPRSSRYRGYIPPSHILKIVKDAEPSSDSSWSDSENENPKLILRDGKPGERYVLHGKEIQGKSKNKSGTSSDSSDSTNDEMILTKQFINKPQTPVTAMDLKNEDSSGDSYDEFGRLKKRYKRPDSAVNDSSLPPLQLDPCDYGDLNHTKARLWRDTLLIRESLQNEEGPDVETIVDAIIRNNNPNRRWIRKMFRDEYLESLMTQIRRILPADIASVVTYMMLPPAEYDAMCLRDAMKGLHKEPEVLIEILCTRTNEEIEALKYMYAKRYDADLLDDLEDETSGSFQKLVLTLAMAKREEDHGEPDKEEAHQTAKALFAILGVRGEQMERKYIEVFGKQGFETLRTILSEYRKFKHHELEADIINEFTGNTRRCLLTIIQYVQNRPGYFVEKLHSTHYGGLDDDKTLTRILISRQDRDSKMIQELFKLRYDMDLFDYIRTTCHSTERGLMLRIIAGQLPEDERRHLQSKLPKLVVPAAMVTFNKRLSLNDAITIVLRKTQVSSTLLKCLNLRRERIAKMEEESILELELDMDEEENEDENSRERVEERDGANSDEDDEHGREEQEELRNNLKNLDFKDEESADPEGGGDKKRSALAQVSFSTAARGINRLENRVKFKTDTDGSDNESGSASGSNQPRKSVASGVGAMPTPVQDPSFIGRRDSNFFERVVPFIKGRRKRYYRGTIKGVPMDDFNALKDAQAVGRALLQKNRNVEGILKFLISRNNSQRQLIVREFFRRYRRDLVDDLRHLTGPDMEDFILGLMLAPEVYDSSCVFEVWNEKNETGDEPDGDDSFVDTITEITCTRGNDEIGVIKRAYQGVFGRDIREDLESVTFGWLRLLLNNILKCERDEGDVVDEKLAHKDALRLIESRERKTGDYDVYIEILTTRNFAHLQAVFNFYSQITNIDILEAFEQEMSGDFLEALTAIVCNVRDAPMYFCERIYQSMALHPMDHKMLVRCVLTRAEVDLNDIKGTFRRTYGRSLYNMVEKECDGKYKPYLMEVIGKGSRDKKKKSKIWNFMH